MERIPPNERVSNIPDSKKQKQNPSARKDTEAKKDGADAPPPPRTDRYEKRARQSKPPQAGCFSLVSLLFLILAILLLSGVR